METGKPAAIGPQSALSSPLGHRLMFLALVAVAFCLFAPTTLLPILDEYCELRAEERRLQEHLGKLEAQMAHSAELVYAFENDTVVNERLAVLDLRYRKPDEVVVAVLSESRPGGLNPCPFSQGFELEGPNQPPRPADATAHFPRVGASEHLRVPRDWPAWAVAARDRADAYGLISLFLDPKLRPILLLMSAGILIAAFVLFAPRRRSIVLGAPLPTIH